MIKSPILFDAVGSSDDVRGSMNVIPKALLLNQCALLLTLGLDASATQMTTYFLFLIKSL